MANDHKGTSGNLGDPVVSMSKAAGDTAYQLPIDPRLRVRGRGDEQRTQRWYRQAKETKRGEMGGRESQHLIVPLKRGNRTEGPRKERGCRLMSR